MSEDRVLSGMICDIYNRCSTTEEAQTRAIETQAAESAELVIALGGIIYHQYIEQESATTTKKRNQYAGLMADVKQEKIDCVVIKSIDRLMRNAGDWHEFIQCITEHKVKLYLYLERKFYEPQDAFLSGIKALIAEQYSRELSQKVNNAHQRRQRQENGRLTINNNVYGYRKENDTYIIEETEAEYIKKMYLMSAYGIGSTKIANELYRQGLRNRENGAVSDVTIRRIIQNPLYMGTVVLHKTHYDFEQKKQYSLPKKEWIYHEGRMPAIVTKQLWDKANTALEERRNTREKTKNIVKEQNIFKGKIRCGLCKSAFCRRKNSAGNFYWICANQIKNSPNPVKNCKNTIIYEKELIELPEFALSKSENKKNLYDVDLILEKTLYIVTEAIKNADENKIHKEVQQNQLLAKKKRLLKKFIDGIISDDDYKEAQRILNRQFEGLEKKENQCVQGTLEERIRKIASYLYSKENEGIIKQLFLQSELSGIEVFDGRLIISFRNEKIAVNYKHINEKSKKKEESIVQIHNYFLEKSEWTAAQLAKNTGLSQGNVLAKLKQLKNENEVTYVSKGKNGGYWKKCEKTT